MVVISVEGIGGSAQAISASRGGARARADGCTRALLIDERGSDSRAYLVSDVHACAAFEQGGHHLCGSRRCRGVQRGAASPERRRMHLQARRPRSSKQQVRPLFNGAGRE